MTADSALAVLITIPLSHYCEKARWALDRAALPYREEPHIPLIHRLATKRNDGGTVPVLAHGIHRLTDSTAILVHADATAGGNVLYPSDAELRKDVDELVQQFDKVLGPHVRRWVYAQLLANGKVLRRLWSQGVPRLEARCVPLIAPLAFRLVRSTYRITPDSAQRSLERCREVFSQVTDRLSDGRPFLAGTRFSAADLTFAALAAPALFPSQCRAVQPSLDEVSPAMREEILRFRDTAAGQFALRLFAQERARNH